MATLAGPSVGSAQQVEAWPIKEFEVVAVEPAGVVDGNRHIHAWVEEMVRIIRTETDYDPDFPPIWDEATVPDSLFDIARQEIESVLHEAAVKLESWGFSSPLLEPVVKNEVGVDAYRVYLVTGRPQSGVYHAQPCHFGIREAVLVLNADVVLASDGSLTDPGVQTVVHELVHAAQFGLPSYSCGSGYPGQWIGEGTARAIGFDVLRQLRGTSSFRGMHAAAWGARMYSEQLPVPGATGTSRAYRSSSFWRWLAEFQRSRPTFPGPDTSWPADYSYLPRLLGRDLATRDCYSDDGPCDAELRWLDAGLRSQFGLSLRELYARFIRAYALYGEGRVHSTEGGSPTTWRKNWLGRSFAHETGMGCAEIMLDRTAEGRQKTFTVSRFPDVAARCWEIEFDGYTEDVVLAVTATHRPGNEAVLEQLTAVMADGSSRVDDARVRTVAGVPETTWYYDHLSAVDTALFLLANVADEPYATRGLANLTVTFTALEEYVAMGVSGEGGSGSGDVGDPTAADIAQPLEFEVAEGDFTVFYVAPGDAVADKMDLDHPVCQVWIKLRDPEEDALWVMGSMSPPIRPGTYSIARSGAPPDLLASRMWTGRTSGRGRLQAFGQSGRLELEFVDHLMIEGKIWTHVHLGLEGGDVNLLVRAEFGLQPGSMVGGILGPKASNHPCFTENEPPDGTRGSGVGSESDESDDSRDSEEGRESDEPEEAEESNESDRTNRPGRFPGAGEPRNPRPSGDPDAPLPDDLEASEDGADGGGPANAALRLEFIEDGGGAIRSRPQVVRGDRTPERLKVSAESFDLQLGIPDEWLTQCSGPNSRQEGIFALIGMGLTETGPLTPGGRHLIDITDAAIELDAATGRVSLEVDFEQCRHGRCQSGHVAVQGAAGIERLAPTGAGSLSVTVTDAALETMANGYAGQCDDLVDFSFTLQAVP